MSEEAGTTLVLLFAMGLGSVSTLAEPALQVMGEQVSELTGLAMHSRLGLMSKRYLIYSVMIGVALGKTLCSPTKASPLE